MQTSAIVETINGTTSWFIQEIGSDNYIRKYYHRIGGPAIIAGPRCEWWHNGVLHREDGPAITDIFLEEWWQNGWRHREDGPAVIHSDGKKEWWVNGNRHRTDGPAIIYKDGSEEWYYSGNLHRLDGPAYRTSGTSHGHWFIHGKDITFEVLEWLTHTNKMWPLNISDKIEFLIRFT